MYRLKLIDPSGTAEPPLRLQQGRFLLLRAERRRGQEHFVRWYAQHGRPWLQQRVEQLSPRGSASRPRSCRCATSAIGGAPAGGASTCTGALFSCRRATSSTSWPTSWCICASRATTNG